MDPTWRIILASKCLVKMVSKPPIQLNSMAYKWGWSTLTTYTSTKKPILQVGMAQPTIHPSSGQTPPGSMLLQVPLWHVHRLAVPPSERLGLDFSKALFVVKLWAWSSKINENAMQIRRYLRYLGIIVEWYTYYTVELFLLGVPLTWWHTCCWLFWEKETLRLFFSSHGWICNIYYG